MKVSPFVTSDGSKNCNRHFNTPATFSGVCLPLFLKNWGRGACSIHARPEGRWRAGAVRWHHRGRQTDKIKVAQVYRKECVVCTEWGQREKASSAAVCLGLHPSKVVTQDWNWQRRKKMLQCKAKPPPAGKEKGRYKKETIKEVQEWSNHIRHFQ